MACLRSAARLRHGRSLRVGPIGLGCVYEVIHLLLIQYSRRKSERAIHRQIATLPFHLRFPTSADYGFAAANSCFIFLIVAIFSIIGSRRTRALEEIN